MATAVTTAESIPYTSKRDTTQVKPAVNASEKRRLGDEYAISLIEEAIKSERVSREEVMRSLRR